MATTISTSAAAPKTIVRGRMRNGFLVSGIVAPEVRLHERPMRPNLPPRVAAGLRLIGQHARTPGTPTSRRYAPGARRAPDVVPEARMTRHSADIDRSEEWAELRARHLEPADQRPSSSARGVHHLALLSSDVERTITFYQDVLEFPLTDLFENRDYQGSTHFFFDIGHGNLLAFFDLPGLDLDGYAEVLGGLHHLAISVDSERREYLRAKLEAAGIAMQQASGSSLYFQGPDRERLELIKDPLGEMYGTTVA